MDEDYGNITLPSGAVVTAIDGAISLSPDLEAGSPYDEITVGLEDGSPLTASQKIELADIMLARWKRYRDQAAAEVPGSPADG